MPYHVSPDGTSRLCKAAKTGVCRFGEDAPHFENRKEALAYSEANLEKIYSPLASMSKKELKATFQPENEKRKLSLGAPQLLKDHIAQSEEALERLDPMERKALRGYSGFAAGAVNNLLQKKTYNYYAEAPEWRESGAPSDFNSREDLKDYVETLDSVLAERGDEEKILYRGTPIYKNIHEELEKVVGRKIEAQDTAGILEGLTKYYPVGKVIGHDTYLSTSSDPYIAAERTQNSINTVQDYWNKSEKVGIVWELKTNAGVDLTGAAGRSYKRERETILPRETYFKISNVELAPKEYSTIDEDFDNIAIVIQMEEVDRDGKPITAKTHKPERSVEEVLKDASL